MNYDDTVSILTSALQREQFPVGEWYQYDGTPPPEVKALPFYGLVPKHPIDQMRWRLYARERGTWDRDFRSAVVAACKADPLFATNTFVFIFEPRPQGRVLPFNTWADQDAYVMKIWSCLGKRDLGCEKGRGLGWSYMGADIFYLDARFNQRSTLGVMSRKEDSVDSKEDPDAFMWKMDFIHKYMPDWLTLAEDGSEVLDRSYSEHRFYLKDVESTVYGYESTSNVMTGGRKRAIWEDEKAKFPASAAAEAAASTVNVTNCRIIVSTYFRGTSTVFYRTMRKQESSMLKIRAHWHQNPERSKGKYTFENGELKLLDKKYWTPEKIKKYRFIDVDRDKDALGGKIRSPWYDFECARADQTRISVAEELEVDPQTSSTKIFEEETIKRATKSLQEPLHRGNIEFDYETFEPTWIPTPNGDVHVWAPLTVSNEIGYSGPYVAGIDTSGGTGRSNSALEILDASTGEQILEYKTNRLDANNFAEHVFAILKWLCGDRGQVWVTVNYEANGIGNTMARRLKELGWGNFYLRETTTNTGKKSKKTGYWHKDAGYTILCELHRAMFRRECIPRSQFVLGECQQYELDQDIPKAIHVGSILDGESGGNSELHGDCAMAMAICWLAVKERMKVDRKEKNREIPEGSLAARIIAASKRRADGDWWDGSDEESPASGAMDLLARLPSA